MLDATYFENFAKLSEHYRSTDNKTEFIRLYVQSGRRIFTLLKFDQHPDYLYWDTQTRLLLEKSEDDIAHADLQTAMEFYALMIMKYSKLNRQEARPRTAHRQPAIYGFFLTGLILLALFTFCFLLTYQFTSPISYTLLVGVGFLGYLVKQHLSP